MSVARAPIVLDPKEEVWWEEMLRALEISESFERDLRLVGPGLWAKIRARSTAVRQDLDFEGELPDEDLHCGEMDTHRRQLRDTMSGYTLDRLLEIEEHARTHLPDEHAAGLRAHEKRRAHVRALQKQEDEAAVRVFEQNRANGDGRANERDEEEEEEEEDDEEDEELDKELVQLRAKLQQERAELQQMKAEVRGAKRKLEDTELRLAATQARVRPRPASA